MASIVPASHVRFDVADVVPSTERLPCVDLKSSLDRVARTKLLVCPDAGREVLRDADFHPLIAAAAFAFKQHYPLILSPDMIWLTVLQGVAQHIQNNPETLRTKLVHHQTKIELLVTTDLPRLPDNDAQMLGVAKAFSDQIARHIQPDKRFLLQVEFSTTTDVERIAANVVLMDAFQPYFDYIFSIICGIPSVILEGTVADWELLSAKVLALHKSDLELSWWTQHLLAPCQHFVRAARRDVDLNHWKDLCKIMERYGVDDMNGWLLKFIPYVRKAKNERPVHRNPVLELTSHDEKPDPRPDPFKVTGCTSNMLPTGISGVPVTCRDLESGEDLELQFLAGFGGVEQRLDDLSLRPLIAWAISEPSAIDVLIQRLRKEHGCTAPKSVALNEVLIELFCGHLPGDMCKFYSEIDGVLLIFRQANQWHESSCRLVSLDSVKPLWDSRSIDGELEYLSSQGEISPDLLAERKNFSARYGRLVSIANATLKHRPSSHYVFGQLDETGVAIYRWTGQHSSNAFTRVADSFTEWLAGLLDAAGSNA